MEEKKISTNTKVFHGFKSWNNNAELISSAERQVGINSVSYQYKDLVKNPFLIPYIIKKFDIFNFHTAYTFLPISLRWNFLYCFLGGLDLYILKLLNKKIILHFQGCDIRYRYYEPVPEVCKICDETSGYCKNQDPTTRRKKIHKLTNIVDAICVTTPDLSIYFPHITYWVPKVSKVPVIRSHKEYNNRVKLRVIHAPSNRSKKGTDKIIEVIQKLKDKFELILIENQPREVVLETAQTCDLAIDQLIIGWYGNFCVEMMSQGLPTIAYLSEDSMNFLDNKNIPIINANINNLENVLLALYDDREKLNEISNKSITFVKEFHSLESIGNKMLSIYHTIKDQ